MATETVTASVAGSGPLDKMNKAALKKANDLMRTFKACMEQKQALKASIQEKLDTLDKVQKEAEQNLILLGERHKLAFDAKGNFHLEDGYLHIAQSTVVATTKKFDPSTFMQAFPDLIDIKLKTAAVKKEWLNKEGNRELRDMGVRIDTVESMQVIANKTLE
jgi:hypothetical protein